MRLIFTIATTLSLGLTSNLAFAQIFTGVDGGGRFYYADYSGCSPVITSSSGSLPYQFYDIATSPDGRLWGVRANGELYEINGLSVSLVHSFGGGGSHNSLTADDNGVIYSATASGQLYSYNPITGEAESLGSMNTSLAGDIVFYRGNLYGANSSGGLDRFNLSTGRSQTVVRLPADSWGIFRSINVCGEDALYIAGTDNVLYGVDVAFGSYHVVGNLPATMFGAASTGAYDAPPPLSICEATTTNAPYCNDPPYGSANITVAGQYPIEVSLDGSNFENASTLNNLPIGEYYVYVRTEDGCGLDSVQVSISPTDSVRIDYITTNQPTCDRDGSATIYPSGGVAPYEFSMDGTNYQNSNSFTGLPAGRYTLYARDSYGCPSAGMEVMLASPNEDWIDTIMVTQSICNQGNGAMEIVLSDVSPTVFISVNGMSYSTQTRYTGLYPGSQSITLLDQLTGCEYETTVDIPTTTPPTFDLQISPATCGEANGSLVLENIVAVDGTLLSSFNNEAYQEGIFVFYNLAAGTYTVQLRDSVGCYSAEQTAVVSESEAPELEIEALPTQCGEPVGSIRIVNYRGTGDYTIWIEDDSTLLAGDLVTGLPSGTYTVGARDGYGCVVGYTMEVGDSQPLDLLGVDIIQNPCTNEPVDLLVSTVSPVSDLAFALNGNATQPDSIFYQVSPGIHILTVSHPFGCTRTDTVEISAGDVCFGFPSAFSPNGDGLNDRFEVITQASILIRQYCIYNRWGEPIYHQTDFQTTEKERFWAGMWNGRIAPSGVYTYMIEFELPNGEIETHRGKITLLD